MAVTEHRGRVMASDVHVVVVDGPSGLAELAQTRLEQLEQRWSRFLPASDITRLNLAAGAAVRVHADTCTLVLAMVEAWRRTAGRYDPTILPALVRAGYSASTVDARLVTPLPDGELRTGDVVAIAVDEAASTVTLPAGTLLDPGGIGKGLAADLVVAELLAAGARGALVGVGGDLAIGGTPATPDGWLVTVERPEPGDGDLTTFAVDGAAGVATSSTRSRRWITDEGPRHHVIDPSTGEPSWTDLATVTVVARTGWLAEAHATAALLAGRDGVLEHLRRHDLSGLAVASDGTVLTTDDLRGAQHAGGTHAAGAA